MNINLATYTDITFNWIPDSGFIWQQVVKIAVACVGAGSVGLSAILTLFIGFSFIVYTPAGGIYKVNLWQWIQTGGFSASISFLLMPFH